MKMNNQCLICKLEGEVFFGSRGKHSLKTHLNHYHNISMASYFTNFYQPLATMDDSAGFCVVCDKPTSWSVRYQCYNKTCSSHCRSSFNNNSRYKKDPLEFESLPKQAVC